jgi:predicted aspartyl protease
VAVGVFATRECVDYLDGEAPALRVVLKEPTRGLTEDLTVPIDTGFSGYVLLPGELYERLGSLELPEEEWGVYNTLAGKIVLRRSRVFMTISGDRRESYVETPLFCGGRLLVGRRVLEKLNLGLFGSRRETCALSETKS